VRQVIPSGASDGVCRLSAQTFAGEETGGSERKEEIMPGKRVPIGDALRFGWQTFKENASFFVGVLLVCLLLCLLPYIPIAIIGWVAERSVSEGGGTARAAAPVLGVVIFCCVVAALVIQFVVAMGFLYICLAFCDGRKPSISELFAPWRSFISYVIANIVYSIICAIGFMLFIIPGIYWTVKYFFWALLIVDRGVGPFRALDGSGAITAGARWELLAFIILLTLINFVGVLCLVVGLLVTIPVTTLALAYVYRTLLAASAGTQTG